MKPCLESPLATLETFRPFERDEVFFPPTLQFPISVKDTVSWVEPSGARAYLVYNDQNRLFGVVFRRDTGGVTPAAAMCEWCHSVRSSGSIGLLTATASGNRRVGVYLCRDLDCKDKLLADAPGVNDVPSTMRSIDARMQRIVARITEFSKRTLY